MKFQLMEDILVNVNFIILRVFFPLVLSHNFNSNIMIVPNYVYSVNNYIC